MQCIHRNYNVPMRDGRCRSICAENSNYCALHDPVLKPAYGRSVYFAIGQMNKKVHRRYCSHCGELTSIMEVDYEHWDRLCSDCRGWTQGFLAWLLRRYGWKLQRIYS